jgi:hypothetical protein
MDGDGMHKSTFDKRIFTLSTFAASARDLFTPLDEPDHVLCSTYLARFF